MRSDAAPALDQTISPTMTGNWTYQPAAGVGITVNVLAGGNQGIIINGASTGADGRATIDFTAPLTTSQRWDLGIDTSGGTTKSFSLRNITNGGTPLSVAAATGAVTIAAPIATGVALTVNGFANSQTALFKAASTSGQALGVLIEGGTTSADYALYVTNQSGATGYFKIVGDGSWDLGYNGSGYTMAGSAAGGVTINTPASGVPLTINATASNSTEVQKWTNGTLTAGLFIGTTPNLQFGTESAHSLSLYTGNVTRFTINSSGAVAVSAPSGATVVALTVNGNSADASYSLQVLANAVSGKSSGLYIAAGTTSADTAIAIQNAAASATYFNINGNGSGNMGPTAALGLSWLSTGAMTIAAPASAAIALTVNGIAGTTPASFNAAAVADFAITLRGFTAGRSVIDFSVAGTDKAYIGVNDAANDLITGSTIQDLILRANGTAIRLSSNSGTTAQLSVTSAVHALLAAGTAAIAPLEMTSGTNLTTATAGVVEYDGTCFYNTPAASSRAVNSTEYVCVMNGTHTLTSQTAAQAIFNSTANGAVTLPIGTYIFECQFQLTGMSTVTGGFGFALGGAATFTQGWSSLAVNAAAVTASNAQMTYDTAANTAIGTASTAGVAHAMIKGIIRVTGAGTVIPQVSLITAAAAVVAINSYFKCYPVGNGTVTTVGNWS